MKSVLEIKQMLFAKDSAVHGQMGKLTPEQEHDLKIQIEVLEWVLST